MDLRQPFSSAWDGHGPDYNQQVHGLSGESSNNQLASGSLAFEPSYHNPFQADTAYSLQHNTDVSMTGPEVENLPSSSIAKAPPEIGSSRRVKYDHLDWNTHKAAIRSLYIDQNKSLSETMESMRKLHSFDASQKLYKAKFKEWNWQKNLPVGTALFMKEKAKRRKREEGKDTVFSFGGRVWDTNRVERTAIRAKRSRVISEDMESVETPNGVSYKTPKPLVVSPFPANDIEDSEVESSGISDDESEDDLDDDPADSRLVSGSKLTLTWRGHSRGDLQNMWRTARDYRDTGKFEEAEDMFLQAFLGLCHVLGNTNEDTVKVAYNLAGLYADSGRMKEAVDMIEKVIQNHINQWGYEDKRTQQNVLHAVELLNGWNRQADALALLSLSEELLRSSSCSHNVRRAHNQANKKGKAVERFIPTDSRPGLAGVAETLLTDLNPARVDYGLGVARARIAAKDQAAEGLLLAMIAQCEDQPNLDVQHLKARAELLRLYDKLGMADEHKDAFEYALESLKKAWEAYSWEDEKIESLDFMEAALQLVANMLKCGYKIQARRMFLEASEKASAVFGSDDERTVWVLITIGLVYQTHTTWDDAEDWFEEAFAAALRNKDWGPKDGIVMSLQNAMDHHHFSYVLDEGRPFKTIFGVSGIKISPGRLHLE